MIGTPGEMCQATKKFAVKMAVGMLPHCVVMLGRRDVVVWSFVSAFVVTTSQRHHIPTSQRHHITT